MATLERERADLIAQQRDDAARIAELERTNRSLVRETNALRFVNEARERTITRLLRDISQLHKRLPLHELHHVTPAEAFRATHPLVEVIGQVVDLAPREDGPARYLVGQCPFCADGRHHSPSLVVRPHYGQYACYACGAHGDIIDFLRRWRERRAA